MLGMLGTPPYCRPECLLHADCPTKLACLNNKCLDPCIGSCGYNAHCTVVNHQPICSCVEGYHGDPFSGCSKGKCFISTLNGCAGDHLFRGFSSLMCERDLEYLVKREYFHSSSCYTDPRARTLRTFALRT